MTSRSRSSSLWGGFLLLGIGSIFLLENWVPGFRAWDFMVRYWPVLPIAIGARKLFLFFTWQDPPAPASAPGPAPKPGGADHG